MLNLPEIDGFYVYILQCKDDSYYTGWTKNLNKRFLAHVKGKGARYTKAHPPHTCVYYEALETQSAAMKREYEIKQLSRLEKERLIATKKIEIQLE